MGYTLNETTPHFSTLSYNFRHRFNSDTVDKIFNWILEEIAKAGYLNTEAVYIDGTHIKANANTKKKIKEEVPIAAKRYAEELLEEINADREAHGKKPFDDVYEEVRERFPEAETIVADSVYKTPHICKKIFEDGRVLSTAYKRPMTMKDGHEWWKYVYDEYYDCIICPEYQILEYSTTNRDGYREYKSNPMICKNCPTREKCTKSKSCQKTVTRHIWNKYIELAENARHTPKYKELYKERKEKIEQIFADTKEKHAMRYTPYRGLTAIKN